MKTIQRRREDMAYGSWTLTDGRTILFNRRYVPLCELSNGRWSALDPGWVEGITGTSNFYNDGHSEAEKQRLSIEATERLGLSIPELYAMSAHRQGRSEQSLRRAGHRLS